MSAPFRRPIFSDKISYIDEFEETKYTKDTNPSSARTLKPPPEIWELVHPVPTQEFKPSQALAARVATKNGLLVFLGILLASGAGLASWKFRIPQQVLAVFAEPETSARKTVPATLKRGTTESAKTNPNSVPPSTVSVLSPPTEPSTNTDPLQASTAVEKKPVHKASKPAAVSTDLPSVNTSSSDTAFSVTTPAVRPNVEVKTKEPQRTTGQSTTSSGATQSMTQTTPGQSLKPTSSTKTANTASDTPPTKPKVSAATTGEAAAPPKTNAPPKPKVIQWP